MKFELLKEATLEDYSNYNDVLCDFINESHSAINNLEQCGFDTQFILITEMAILKFSQRLLEVQAAWDLHLESANSYLREGLKLQNKLLNPEIAKEEVLDINKEIIQLIEEAPNYLNPIPMGDMFK
ncbi:MAG: hypothetical protein ACK5NF_07290 [Bacilli bacterium]